MKADIGIQADILKTMMSNAQEELRRFHASIYNVISALTVASYLLTAFLLGRKEAAAVWIADGGILGVVWGLFLQFKWIIRGIRKGLVSIQNKIENLDKNKDELVGLFAKPECEPDISDNYLWWFPIVSTVAIVGKDVLIALLRIF